MAASSRALAERGELLPVDLLDGPDESLHHLSSTPCDALGWVRG